MMRVAITGGIACGKSLVSKYLNEFGVETIDADDIVHRLLPDPEERKRIAAEVFSDPEKRKALEEKLHPQVKAEIEDFLSRNDGSDGRLPRVAVIPLLFETGWNFYYDVICCVSCSYDKQISRMMENRGYTHEEAEKRLSAQWPIEEKTDRSHYVIDNDGTPEELRERVRDFVAWLRNI